jgi:hypothetical protein
VIRIRYPDFSSGASDLAGLHGIAEPTARGVTVYLLPGLTGGQRKAVIRRLRQEASRGFGPALPLFCLVIALGVDRMRMAAGTAVAVFRLHPAAMLLSGAAAAAMALFVLSSTGGVPGPAPRPGLAGVLVGNGHPASGAGAAVGSVIGDPDGIGLGGSGLGSAVPATGWRARPHGAHRVHAHKGHAHKGHAHKGHRRHKAHRTSTWRYQGQLRHRWHRCHRGLYKLACRRAES